MILFRDLAIGDTFDFNSTNRIINSFYTRCVKRSARTYAGVTAPTGTMRVGTIDVPVYHVVHISQELPDNNCLD